MWKVRKPGVIMLALFFLCLPAEFLPCSLSLIHWCLIVSRFHSPPHSNLAFFSLAFTRYHCCLYFTHFFLSLLLPFLCLNHPTNSIPILPKSWIRKDRNAGRKWILPIAAAGRDLNSLRRECLLLGLGERATGWKDTGMSGRELSA